MMEFKTVPYGHQQREWSLHRQTPTRAVFWEQGTGKSKLTIDTAAWMHWKGLIDAVLVIAPNGVHENWITDEIPTHLPDEIPSQSHSWSSRRASTKRHEREAESLLKFVGMSWLAMSYDAFMTKKGRKFAEKFLASRDVLMVLDESQRIKSARAKRTRSLVAFGRRTPWKRILSGTPVTNTPFDIYPQMKFLDEDFWKKEGFASYEAFKTYFGVWEQRLNGQTGQRFNQCVYFKNLPELNRIITPTSSRVTKEDVLDLPPKVYSKRYVELSPEQSRLYERLKEEFILEFDSGETVTAPMAITQLLRFQQLICGYIGTDDDELILLEENPRLKLLLDILQDVEGSAIIYARFRQDIDQICQALGNECVRYDGDVGEAQRLEARQRFQAGDVRYFVGNPAACGLGLTLHRAKTVIYYSNSFNYGDRLQSEDRAHRIGQESRVHYIDLVARGTVDMKIVGALRDKRNLASEITGDELREWL